MSVNMNAHLYTKKERDIHTICKRCKAQAPINCSKEDYNLFLNYLPYTQSYNIEKQHLFFYRPISAYLHALVFFV